MINILWFILTIPLRLIVTIILTFLLTFFGIFILVEDLDKKGPKVWKNIYKTYNDIWHY